MGFPEIRKPILANSSPEGQRLSGPQKAKANLRLPQAPPEVEHAYGVGI